LRQSGADAVGGFLGDRRRLLGLATHASVVEMIEDL